MLDEEFEVNLIDQIEVPPVSALSMQLQSEKKRLAELKVKTADTGDPEAQQLLDGIAEEGADTELETLLRPAQAVQDYRDRAAKLLRDLQIQLDALESGLAWPAEVGEAEKNIQFATDIVEKHGSAADKDTLRELIQEVRVAIQRRDVALLKTRSNELVGFAGRVWMKVPEYWIGVFVWLQNEKAEMRDKAAATELFARGLRAIEMQDTDTLRNICQQLRSLLPERVRGQKPDFDSTIW